MKHLLNNLTEEEKNSIRGQHTGGMEVNAEKFKTLSESKLGNVKTLLSEQEDYYGNLLYDDIMDVIRDSNSSKEEIIGVLEEILRDIKGEGYVTKEKVRKHWGI